MREEMSVKTLMLLLLQLPIYFVQSIHFQSKWCIATGLKKENNTFYFCKGAPQRQHSRVNTKARQTGKRTTCIFYQQQQRQTFDFRLCRRLKGPSSPNEVALCKILTSLILFFLISLSTGMQFKRYWPWSRVTDTPFLTLQALALLTRQWSAPDFRCTSETFEDHPHLSVFGNAASECPFPDVILATR